MQRYPGYLDPALYQPLHPPIQPDPWSANPHTLATQGTTGSDPHILLATNSFAYTLLNSTVLTGHSLEFMDSGTILFAEHPHTLHQQADGKFMHGQALSGTQGWVGGRDGDKLTQNDEEIDERRENSRGQLEKWCPTCRVWINLGDSQGSDYAFRQHHYSRICQQTVDKRAALLKRWEIRLASAETTARVARHCEPLAIHQSSSQDSSSSTNVPAAQCQQDPVPSGYVRCPQCEKQIKSTSCRVHMGKHILQAQRARKGGPHSAENVCLFYILSDHLI